MIQFLARSEKSALENRYFPYLKPLKQQISRRCHFASKRRVGFSDTERYLSSSKHWCELGVTHLLLSRS